MDHIDTRQIRRAIELLVDQCHRTDSVLTVGKSRADQPVGKMLREQIEQLEAVNVEIEMIEAEMARRRSSITAVPGERGRRMSDVI